MYVERKCFQEFSLMVVVSRAYDVVIVKRRLNASIVSSQRCDLPMDILRILIFFLQVLKT